MDERAKVAWLHRRAGFGLHPDALDAAVERGADAELGGFSVAANDAIDPWAGVELDPQQRGRFNAVSAWITAMHESAHPFTDRRTWFLHGWLVSALGKVELPQLLVGQIRLFMAAGGGSFPDILRRVTIDPAMLDYLDGRQSTGEAPNENYGRELLELFALGVGNYTEQDVQAAATALTGWIVARGTYEAEFRPGRHDDTPQTLLGVDGVRDVESVIRVVTDHPAHERFVAARVMTDYLGDVTGGPRTEIVDHLAQTYLDNDRNLDPVIVEALRLGLDGGSERQVISPLPWVLMCTRSTGLTPTDLRTTLPSRFADLDQIPMLPPSVVGWARGTAWLSSSSLVTRANIAALIAAAATPDQPTRVAVADGDLDALAQHLGLPEPFSNSTAAAIMSAPDPVARLAIALVAPENLLS